VVAKADRMLVHMAHRGGTGCEPSSGDGAGLMLGLPHEFYARICRSELDLNLPPPGEYGTGLLFLPQDQLAKNDAKRLLTSALNTKGFQAAHIIMTFRGSRQQTVRT